MIIVLIDTVFDYPEIYYISGDPLVYLLIKELNQSLRLAFDSLVVSDKEIIQELILSDLSIKDFLFKYGLKDNELETRIKNILQNLYELFYSNYCDYLL